MTVSLRAAGTGSNGSSSVSVAAPAGRVAGDLLLCWVGTGEANNAQPSLPAGWALLNTEVNVGAPAFGVDAGPRRISCYWRIADGTSADDAVVTAGGSGSTRVTSAIIVAYQKTLAEWLPLEWVGASQTTGTTGFSIGLSPTWDVTDGDFLSFGFAGVPDTNGLTATALAWTGTGSSNLDNKWQSAAGGGNDQRFHVGDRPVTGASSGSPIFTANTNQDSYGAIGLVRLRDSAGGGSATPGTVVTRWAGAVTDSSFVVAAQVTESHPVRLTASTSSGFSSALSGLQQVPDAQGRVKVSVDGLAADTHYFYALEFFEDSAWRRDTAKVGELSTFPAEGSAADFVFGHGNCHAQGATNAAFDLIRQAGLRFFLHTGDFHYENIANGTDSETARDLYRAPYEGNLTTGEQDAMYAVTPVVYLYDDHDYCGDNSDRTSAGRENVTAVYRQCAPHYELPDSAGLGIWQTFVCGRVRFLMLDTRTYRDPVGTTDDANKTMLGAEQKAWLKATMLASSETQFVIMTGVPWVQSRGTTGDGWGRYDTERQELVTWFEENGFLDSLVIINGDMHGLAADDGTNSAGGIPTVIGGSMGSSASTKGGPYSQGTAPGSSHYGRFEVDDTGSVINLAWTGRESVGGTDTQILSLAATLEEATPARVTFSELDSGENATDGTAYASNQFAVAAGQRVLLAISSGMVGAAQTPPAVASAGVDLGMSLVAEVPTANLNVAVSLWEGEAPVAGDVTLSWDFTATVSWASWRVVGMRDAGAVAQAQTVASTLAADVSLDSAPALTSSVVSFFLTNSSSAVATLPPAWVEFGTSNTQTNPSGMSLGAYRTPGEQTAAWSSTNNAQKALIIAEVPYVPAAVSFEGSASLGGAGSLTAGGQPKFTGAAALGGGGSLSTAGGPAVSRSASLAGAGTLTATGRPAVSRTVALAGAGSLSATGRPAVSRSAALSGSGLLSVPTRTPAAAGAATLGGTGALAAAASAPSAGGLAALVGAGTLQAETELARSAIARLAGHGSLALATAVYNYAINPSAETNVTLVGTSSGTLSIERSSARAWAGTYSFRTYWNTTPGSTISQIRPVQLGPFPAGTTKTFKVRFFVPVENVGHPTGFQVQYRDDAAGAMIQSVIHLAPEKPYVPGEWNTMSHTYTVPEGWTLSSLYWRLSVPDRVQADSYHWDALQISDDPDEAYFDGDTPPTASSPEAYNLCINPSTEAGGAWNSWNSSLYPVTADTTVARSGTRSRRSDLAVAGPIVGNFAHIGRSDFTLTPVEQGKQYRFGVYARAVVGGLRGRAYAVERNSSGVEVARTYGDYVELSGDGSWTRLPMSLALASAQAAGAVLSAEVSTVDGSDAPVGTQSWIDDATLVEGTVLPAYFDGSYAGAEWLGTPNASVSIIPTERYDWTGTPHGSTSYRTRLTGEPSITGAEAEFAGAGALAATGGPAAGQAASLSGGGSLSAGGRVAVTRGAALTGSGSLSAAGRPAAAGTAVLAGAGTLAATGGGGGASTAAFSGAGLLAVPTGAPDLAGAAELAGTGALTSVGGAAYGGAAALAGAGSLAASGSNPSARALVALAGAGSLNATGGSAGSSPGLLAGSGTLTALGRVAVARSAALAGAGLLTAGGAPTFVRLATLAGQGTLTGIGAPELAVLVPLSGAGSLTATGTGREVGEGLAALAGSGLLTSPVARAALTGAAELAGDGTLEALGSQPVARGLAALEGEGVLVAGAHLAVGSAALLSGAGLLSVGDPTPGWAGLAALSGSGFLSATYIPPFPPVREPVADLPDGSARATLAGGRAGARLGGGAWRAEILD